eukprot:gene15503-20922_t
MLSKLFLTKIFQRGSTHAQSFLQIGRKEFFAVRSFSVETTINDGYSGALADEYKEEVSDILNDYDERKRRKQSKVGIVVSVKCQKSISVLVEHKKLVRKYNKMVNVRRKIMAHDAEETCRLGDTVRIGPGRPMSKMKRHHLLDIIKRAPILKLEPETPIENAEKISENNEKDL